jgi:hypothetical protein
MATSFAHTHTHRNIAGIGIAPAMPARNAKPAEPGVIAQFVGDLFEDLRQKPLQDAKFAKHDMFREHINAMSISYFSLIVLLIVGSVFLLPALMPILTQ